MHPEMERQMAVQRVQELRRAGAAARLRAAAPHVSHEREIVIREARPADDLALAALAVLDDAKCPAGATLVAEADGSIRAALPLDGPRPSADPFRHPADLVVLLEARARQVAPRSARAPHPRRAWLARFV